MIIDLAIKQCLISGKELSFLNILDFAIQIRKWIDKHPKKSKAILEGKEFKNPQLKYYYNKGT